MAKNEQKPGASVTVTTKTHYEEWPVQITVAEKRKRGSKEVEKIVKHTKIGTTPKRPRVMITDEQAAILNFGVLDGDNGFAVMYFKPGSDELINPFVDENDIVDEFGDAGE
jgi:ATP:corrinoid adenosyltransferase